MPEVHVYVSRADKALLEELPGELTVAQLLREALRRHRAEVEACAHPNLERHCPDCHWREQIPIDIPSPSDVDGVDIPGNPRALAG